MQTKATGKLIMAGVSLLMAVVLLAVGTFAWFTFSKKPEMNGINVSFNSDTAWPFEVSVDNGQTWHKELNVSSVLKNAALRPISTYDLQHWYLADYDYAGNVTKLIEVPLSDVANREDKTASPSSIGEDGINYVLYFDMWVRTRDPEVSYVLRFNNPDQDASGVSVDDWETTYGTYVLWTPVWDTTAGKYTAADDAMSSIRVGFLVYDQDDDTQIANTIIYEPNVDLHNGLGSAAQDDRYAGISYVKGSQTDLKIDEATATNIICTTTVPYYVGADTYTMVAQETSDTNRSVILQSTSSWDANKLNSMTELSDWDSRCIKNIGAFINADGTPIDRESLPKFATISHDKIQKIRVFFWLEGQDVDCWNQIAGGSIYANLEFYGEAAN